jgi:hypothetical protein
MSTTKQVQVKSGKQIVATVDIVSFDSVSEALGALGEKKVLDLLNTQHATNAKNSARAAAVGKPTKASRLVEAIARCTVEEMVECGGDKASVQALLDSKIKEMEEEDSAK